MSLPPQLQKPEFKLVLIHKGQKGPHEVAWQKRNHYSFNHKKIQAWKGNLGIVCGCGNLVVLDIDNEEYIKEFDSKTDTFTVKTGSGKRHYYFTCGEKFAKNFYVLGNKAGELRVSKSQVVTVGSVHPSGNKYEVYKDVPIRAVNKDEIQAMLGELINKKGINSTDTSRSGQDWKDVCELISAGYNYDDTNREMMLTGTGRWQEETQNYKINTYCNALRHLKKHS